MPLFSQAKVRILLSLVIILTIVSAFVVTFVSHRSPSQASGPAITAYEGTHGALSRAMTSHFPIHGTTQQSSNSGSGPRLPFTPHRTGGSATTSDTGAQSPNSADVGTDTSTGQLLHNFRGLNAVDNYHVNGFVLEPPDQGLCVGTLLGTKVVGEAINDVVAFYYPNGALFGPEESLNTFFGEPNTINTSDPRCYYDPTTQTWFFTIVAYPNTLVPNHTDLLVLQPNLFSAIYRIDTTFPNDKAGKCPCFGDQPKLGIDKNNVYITVDQFGGPGQSLETGDTLIAISKSQLVKAAAVVNVAEFHNLSLAGIGVTSMQPAITNSNSNVEFFLNSFPYKDEAQLKPNTTSHILGLWALSNTKAVTNGGVPDLSATIITSEVYRFPVPALTTNGLSLATFTNDSRMQQVQFINGQLWGALGSAVNVKGDSKTRDGAAWFELQPVVNSSGKILGAHFTDQGYVGVKGEYLIYPAITTTFGGTTGISFSITSRSLNPSTGYVIKKPGSADFGTAHITAVGTKPDIGFTCALGFPQQCRWGDYSWATLDPNGQDIWMASELSVRQVATQIFQGHPFRINWATQVWDVMGNH